MGGLIGSLSNSVSDTVISTYSSVVTQQAQNGIAALFPGASLTTAPVAPSTTIILTVEQGTGNTTSRTVTAAGFFGQLIAPYTQLFTAPPQVVSKLTFDVAPSPITGPDGFVQNIDESYSSRESIHQTASGYYVDQFNLSPGQISITVATLIRGDFIKRLKNFTDVLRMAKMSNSSLQPTAAPNLRYINSIDGRSLLLSQTDVKFSQSADRPNIVYVTINGAILVDYNYPVASANPVALGAAQAGTLSPVVTITTPTSSSGVSASSVGGLTQILLSDQA